MSRIIQVVTTTNNREEAECIAKAVVQQRLAACAQVSGPVTSYYWWEGKLANAEEWVCRMKTREEKYGSLQDRIREMHSYDVPEILAIPVVSGNSTYLEWVADETT